MPVRKRFGQHFLHDPGVIRRIIDGVSPAVGERIVEIGPGRGALTWDLLRRAQALDVIEIDRDLARSLQEDPRATGALHVHVENALDTDFVRLRAQGAPLRIVGNLPYNISTPLLFRLLAQAPAILDLHLMLQREVAARLAAQPGDADYGRLGVMLAPQVRVERLFDVGPGAFQPAPKVWSAVVRLSMRAQPLFAVSPHYPAVVAAAFMQRRKTLRNALSQLLTREQINACGVDPGARPETLTPQAFNTLAQALDRAREARDVASKG